MQCFQWPTGAFDVTRQMELVIWALFSFCGFPWTRNISPDAACDLVLDIYYMPGRCAPCGAIDMGFSSVIINT